MKKLKRVDKPEPIESSLEKETKSIILDCVDKGQVYRKKFSDTWDEIELQIRQQPPPSWAEKEEWQTKIYIPLQANGSEMGFSKHKKILFSGTKIVDITGVEKEDKKKILNLLSLFEALMGSKFEVENDCVVQEGVDYGSSFLKVLANSTKDGLVFTWRSVYNCMVDPSCGNDFSKARWWIDEYKKDIGDLIGSVNKKGSLYKKSVVKKMVEDATHQATLDQSSKADTDLTTIRDIDGTANVQIPAAWKQILIYEWWGLMKRPVKTDKAVKQSLEDVTNYTNEWRVITMAVMGNKEYILRDDTNEYGGIPAVMLQLKPRKFEVYGRGYLENGIGVQELSNSMINLGFDSEKLNAFDITLVNSDAIEKWNTIIKQPNALWHMKDINGVKSLRQGVPSALMGIIKGLGFVDQMYQDATSLTRQAGGSFALQGQGTPDTLGEYQSKMQMVDDKFLAQAKIVESRYIKPLFSHIYRILANSKLFTQAACDRILGFDIVVEQKEQIEPTTGQPVMMEREKKVSKLILKELDSKIELDFKLVGVTQLQEVIQVKEQLMQVLELASKFPPFMQYIKPDGLLRNIVQSIRLADPNDIIKSEEELGKEQQEAEQGQIAQMGMQIQKLMQVIQQSNPAVFKQLMAEQQQQQQQQPAEGGQ